MTRHHPLRNRPSKLWSHGRGRLDTIGEISFLVAAHSIDISRELIIVPYEARMLVARESYGPSGGRSRILPTSAESLDLVRFHQGKAIKILIKTKRIVLSVSICQNRSSHHVRSRFNMRIRAAKCKVDGRVRRLTSCRLKLLYRLTEKYWWATSAMN